MSIETFYYSSQFKKSLKKFTRKEQKRIQTKLELFAKDPFNPQLKTHKLVGRLSNYWSFSVDFELRILFEFINERSVGLVDIGTHSIYR